MKKRFLLLFMTGILAAASGQAEEEVSLSTYYPIPSGAYATLNSSGTSTFATSTLASPSVVMGGSTAPTSSNVILSLANANKGLVLPQALSTSAITTPANGLLIYDVSDNLLKFYDSGNVPAWQSAGGAGGASTHWTQSGTTIYNNNSNRVHIGPDHTYFNWGIMPTSKLVAGSYSSRASTVFYGTVGSTPTTPGGAQLGAGIRMMWIPAKASFRAGEVTGTHWDDANIGSTTWATGYNTIARSNNSVAMGNTVTVGSSTTSGVRSIGLGTNLNVYGDDAIAIGQNITLGSSGSSSNGRRSIGIGRFINIQAERAIVLGRGVSAGSPLSNSINGSIMIGYNSTTPDITITGNVGIGTTVPLATMHVVGGNNTVYATGTISICSDIHLKKNVDPLASVLSRLQNVRAVQFEWNEKAEKELTFQRNKKQLGFIAQEIEESFPELVNSSGEYKSVDYFKMGSVVLAGINEFNEKIDRQLKEASIMESAGAGVPR